MVCLLGTLDFIIVFSFHTDTNRLAGLLLFKEYIQGQGETSSPCLGDLQGDSIRVAIRIIMGSITSLLSYLIREMDMAIPLLRTKLYIPPPQSGLVHCPRLTKLINEGLTRKLTLISAPAGFGKTTLLSEWIPTSPRPVTWLSLEEADNDPIRFWTYFMAALQILQENLVKDAQAFFYAEGQQKNLAQPR